MKIKIIVSVLAAVVWSFIVPLWTNHYEPLNILWFLIGFWGAELIMYLLEKRN